MARLIQIMCINKIPRLDPNESITHVGGVNSDGTRWRLSLQDVISYIELGRYEFYVHVDGKAARVIVATSSAGNKYLKTEPDSTTRNNLLSLPECP